MNMQQVGANYFILVLARMEALQTLMMRTEQNIQNQRNAYAETKRLALRRRVYLSEFDTLHPTAPVDNDFVPENSEIISLQAEIDALIASRGLFVGGFASLPKRRRVHSLKVAKAQKIADYHNGRTQLTESLTENEFTTLYPEPTSFTTEKTIINDSSVEVNKLHSFLKSGTWPNPGLHDVDLLIGTATTYP